jgi:cobalt ECF transporter T component CbiQ
MSGVHQKPRGNFVENTVRGVSYALERAISADLLAGSAGLLQRIDPRVKLAGMVALMLATALSAKLWVIAVLLALAITLAVISRVAIGTAMAPVWAGALMLTGAIALPALVLTPGESILRLSKVNLDITAQGLRSASFLLLRAETSTTLAILLVFTTPWTHVLKALRVFRVPVVFVVVLGMTFRYVLLLLETAQEMFESRQSRTVGKLKGPDYRHMAVASGGVLLAKSFHLSGEVFLAMQSRGFRGEVYVLDEFEMQNRDWAALFLVFTAAAAAIWAGR